MSYVNDFYLARASSGAGGMTVCDQCNQLCEGLGPYCDECRIEREELEKEWSIERLNSEVERLRRVLEEIASLHIRNDHIEKTSCISSIAVKWAKQALTQSPGEGE